MKKQFKVVFRHENNTYELWFTDHKGEWVESDTYYTFKRDGGAIENDYNGLAMINESIMWELNNFIELGYKFLGIEKA